MPTGSRCRYTSVRCRNRWCRQRDTWDRIRRSDRMAGKDLDHRTAQLSRHEVFRQRALKRFVMFREWSLRQTRAEEGADAVGLHDERQFPLFLIAHRRPGTVRNVTHPFAVRPFQDRPAGIVRLSVLVNRSTVVDNPPVYRPGPAPFGKEAKTCGVILLPALHEVGPVLGEASRMNPVAARSLSVSLEVGKARNAIPLLVGLVADGDVFEKISVDSLGDC